MELQFYTVKYVAQYLELTEETIREKLRKGEIDGIKIGKSWRVSEENLKKFLNNK